MPAIGVGPLQAARDSPVELEPPVWGHNGSRLRFMAQVQQETGSSMTG